MRRRLALVSLAVTSLVVLAFIIPLATLARNQAEIRALSAAETEAGSIATALAISASSSVGETPLDELADTVLDAFASPPAVSIVFPDGLVKGAPVTVGPSIERAREGLAFNASVEGGIEVLVPVLTEDILATDAAVVVRTLVTDDELRQGVVIAWLLLGGLGVFLIVVAVIAADRLGRSVVRPVSELASAARALGEGSLDTRVEPGGPEEIADVGEAFNFLAGQLGALLAAERESVADLSHRLRTPLTALRLQAETLSDADEAATLLADVDRMEKAVDRMINEARRTVPAEDEAPISDLGSVVRQRATFWKILADEQSRPASVHTTGGRLPVALPASEIGAVIDTLLANVFSYTAPGVGYGLAAAPAGTGFVRLVITDEGPGFVDEAVLERGTSGGGSTGLGLDIARRTAEQTGGELIIRNRPEGGARVEVVFGRAGEPTTQGPEPDGFRSSKTFTTDGSSR